jgi:ring-1,2-phenylacetyl-CoA epoxidase subunit PaaC
MFYQYAAEISKDAKDNAIVSALSQRHPVTEDTLAFLRDVRDFRNCLLVELDRGDWAQTILRQFFFSAYQLYLYRELQNCNDERLAAIAEKALKEVTYHLRWSSEWVIRMGDGTAESHERMEKAVESLWTYTGELLEPAGYEKALAATGMAVDPASFKAYWLEKIKEIFNTATLAIPEGHWMQTGGKAGVHTEHLGYILAEMQFLQRAYPGAEW